MAKAAKTFQKKSASKPAFKKPDAGPKGNAADKSSRQRISSARITGKLMAWKGTMGWIIPSQRIAHKEAQRHGGKIFLHVSDVEAGHKMVKGGTVSFFAYTDGRGIGGEHVMAVASGATKFKAAAQAVSKLQKLKKPHVEINNKGNKGLVKKTISKAAAPAAKAQPNTNTPDRSSRKRISSVRISGKLNVWKGTMGWIIPSQPIAHNAAKVHNGKVYLHASDVEPGQSMAEGRNVTFFPYTDGKGIGAEHVIAVASSGMTKLKAATTAVQAANRLSKLNKPNNGAANKLPVKKTISKPTGNGKVETTTKMNAEHKAARQRITSARITGKLTAWRGSFGWIIPSQSIAHKDAKQHGGKIFIHASDVEPGNNMVQGSNVSFFAYTDGKGIGAEHVMAVGASGASKFKAAGKAGMFAKKLQKISKR